MSFTKLSKSVLNVSALPDKVSNQAQALKATFDKAGVDIKDAHNTLIDELETTTGASNIGALDGINPSTIQAIINAFSEALANRYTKEETDALTGQETNNLIADFDVNLTNGIITVTKKDGTTEKFDTALEKVPATFEIVESGDNYYLKITNVDGTSTQTDITNLMNIYNFSNGNTIAFTVSGEGNEKSVAAEVRDGSITLAKLSLDAVSTLEGYVSSAATSASQANQYRASASDSMYYAMVYKDEAVASATSASNSATSAAESMTEATAKSTAAKSWAVGGTGTRTGEDTNNAKYWAEQAKDSASDGDMMKSTYDTNNNGIVDNAEKLGGQLPEYYAKKTDLDNLPIKELTATEENPIDFNLLINVGYYLIKNCSVTTTLNSGITSSSELDYMLEVRRSQIVDGIPGAIWQTRRHTNNSELWYRSYNNTLSVWNDWAILTKSAKYISFGGVSSTTDLTAGESSLANGQIYLVYE